MLNKYYHARFRSFKKVFESERGDVACGDALLFHQYGSASRQCYLWKDISALFDLRNADARRLI
jgi:hypothetical protein